MEQQQTLLPPTALQRAQLRAALRGHGLKAHGQTLDHALFLLEQGHSPQAAARLARITLVDVHLA